MNARFDMKGLTSERAPGEYVCNKCAGAIHEGDLAYWRCIDVVSEDYEVFHPGCAPVVVNGRAA